MMPEGRVVETSKSWPEHTISCSEQHQPFPACFSEMLWNPQAVRVDNRYIRGYDDDWDEVLAALPKIPEHEAVLLLDLLSKVFVFDPAKRPTASELLSHAWFRLDEPWVDGSRG